MFIKVRRGESVQNFNIWVYGDGTMARGSGVYVGEEGVACNHHFLLPKDGTRYEFVAGDYNVEVFASLVGQSKPDPLYRFRLSLSEAQATAMKDKTAGVFFDWGPDAGRYHSHVDEHPGHKAI